MNIQLAIAGISHELELRVSLACNLLDACGVSFHIRPWLEGSCDAVVVDMSDSFGRLVYDLAVRRRLRILAFTHERAPLDVRTTTIEHAASVATIARILREVFIGRSQMEDPSSLPGILGISLRLHGSDEAAIARSGSLEVMLRPSAARIQWMSRSDIYAAETRLLDRSWTVARVARRSIDQDMWATSCSLETFLVRACRRHDGLLPMLGRQTYRLRTWPDLGGLVDDIDALRLAAALRASAWSVSSLAHHTGISEKRVNGFFLATLASGALEKELLSKPLEPARLSKVSLLIQRVARHFGMIQGSYARG